jgi:hypothetical protein
MPEENVETVRALIELWNVGDRRVELFPEYCDPAIELEGPLSSVVGEPTEATPGSSVGSATWMSSSPSGVSASTICARSAIR